MRKPLFKLLFITFAALVGGSLSFIAGTAGTHAVAGVTYAVYNETQGRYFTTLQEALDDAWPGDYIKVTEQGLEFNEGIKLRVNDVVLDLNGARVRAPGGQDALTVAGQVYHAVIRNGSLLADSIKANGIYAPGDGAYYPLKLRLENMEIEGSSSIKFERDGELEWYGGAARGLNYGVWVAYAVQNFTGVFSSVTFERHIKGAVYFSGLNSNHPSTYFVFQNCQWGRPDNPLPGSALWVEAGTTSVSIQGGSIEASREGLSIIKINAYGEVDIKGLSIHRGDRTALDIQTEAVRLRENFLSRGAFTTSPSPNIPAIVLKSRSGGPPTFLELENNEIKGPGDLGLSISAAGDIIMRDNILEGFATGLYISGAQKIIAEENSVISTSQGIVMETVSGGNLRNNTIQRPLGFTGGVAPGILVLRSRALDIEGLRAERWPVGLKVSEGEGVNITSSTFRNNGIGMLLSGSRDVILSGSLWEENDTGLIISGSTQVNLEGNIFTRSTVGAHIENIAGLLFSHSTFKENDTGVRMVGGIEGVFKDNFLNANNTGLDLQGITQARLDLTRNDIFNNTMGVKAREEIEIAAPLNFWGSSSGPYHRELNPEGHGEYITGKLIFSPWAPHGYYLDDKPPELTLTCLAEKWLTREPLTLGVAVYEETWLDKATLVIYGSSGEKVMERIWWGEEGRNLQEILVWETAEIPDGWYTLIFAAEDGKGNARRVEDRLLLDREPPSNLEVLINGGAMETSQLTVELRLRGEDATGIKEVSISNEGGPRGSWEPFSEFKVWELLPGPPGERRVIVIFRDEAGWEAEAKATIVYAPVIEQPGPGGDDSEERQGFEGDDGSSSSDPSNNGFPGNDFLSDDGSSGDTGSEPSHNTSNGGREREDREQPAREIASFKDVPSTHWAYTAITALFHKGLIYGRGDGLFAPESPITRAEFAILLDRVLGLPEGGKGDWPDVPLQAWYRGAVARLAWAGIMNGYQDGTFRPQDGVTREEAALILFRSLKKVEGQERVDAYARASYGRGNSVSVGEGQGEEQASINSLEVFIDGPSVSLWAREGVQWAVGQGLLRGYPGGLLKPQALLTRAEAAALIYRFLGLLERGLS